MKPAEQTPLTALRVGELMLERASRSVVNLLPDTGQRSAAMRGTWRGQGGVHRVDEVGHLIMRAAADTNLKRVTLNSGEKAPTSFLPMRTWMRPLRGAHFALFFNQASAAAPVRGSFRGKVLRRVCR